MISQARIARSQQRFDEYSDSRGLVSRIPNTLKTNKGRELKEPLEVTEIFNKAHKKMSSGLSDAVQGFGKKKRAKRK
jgi:hypothetical protein